MSARDSVSQSTNTSEISLDSKLQDSWGRAGVERFLEVYPQYIEQVKPELNGLFREEDYPSIERLREKFAVKLTICNISAGEDFRVKMSVEERAASLGRSMPMYANH